MSWLRPPRDPAGALLWHTRLRLAAVTLLMLTTLVIVIGVTTAFVATTLMRQSIDRALDAAASDPLTLHELFEDEEESEYAGPLVEADTFVMLVDAEGNIYGSTTDSDPPGLPDMAAIAAAASSTDRRSGTYGELDLRLLTRNLGPVEIEDEDELFDEDEAGSRTTLYLQAGHDLSLERELEQQLLVAITLIGLLGIGGAVVVTLFLTNRALIPIREAFDTERRFVAAASHELRTPVAIIRASAEIIEREGHVDTVGRPFLDDIVGETERMGRLVGDLMTLASTHAGALAVDRRAIELGAYFDDIARRSASVANARGVRPVIEAPAHGLDAKVDADPDRLDQLLLVLVDNALKHSPPGGELRLSLTVDEVGRKATIEISDDGPGIDPAELERIFEPFERSGAGRNSGEGAGLGLAIARQLAIAHDASLDVTNEPGPGATFALRLPLVDGSRRRA